MHLIGIYVILGLPLFFLSVVNLNLMLSEIEAKRIANFQLGMIKLHTVVVFFTVLITYVSGMINLLAFSTLTRMFMIASTLIMWAGLMVVEISALKEFLESGLRPRISKKFLDYVFYLLVLWLVFEKLDVGWKEIGVLSTVLMVSIIYFGGALNRYRKITRIIIEPLDLFTLNVGIRIFSSLIAMMLIAYSYYQNVYRGFIALSLLILTAILWYTTVSIEKLVKLR